MLAKHAHKFGPNWDLHLQQLLFAYRVKPQDSTGEAGRDARLPTESPLSQPLTPYQEDLSDYPSSLVAGLSEAWSTARKNISKAQGKQKLQYDKKLHPPKFSVGDRVMFFMPQETKGKACKLTLPHHGLCRILEITRTGASVRPVDCPDERPILVNLDRVTRYSDELPNVTWLGPRSWCKCREHCQQAPKTATKNRVTESRYELRSRAKSSPVVM